MRRAAFGLLASLVVVAAAPLGVASAADMAIKAPPAPAPAESWTGFYAGINGGYAWKDSAATFTPNDFNALALTCGGAAGSTCPPPASFNTRGGLWGVQAGYNWQANQAWLVGIEADFNGSHIGGSGTSNFLMAPLAIPPGTSNFAVNQNADWFGTVRGRLGWTPASNTLFYATAGFAYGHVTENIVLNTTPGLAAATGNFGFSCTTGTNCFLGGSSRTVTGWTAGGGAEYALTHNLSLKGELLYVNLGGGDTVRVTSVANGGVGTMPTSFSASFSRLDFYVARAGVNWKF